MEKEIKFLIAIYIAVFVSFIFNIVVICITGSSLFNNIMAWVCASIWAVMSLIQNLMRQDDYKIHKQYERYLEEYIVKLIDDKTRLINELEEANKTNGKEE